METINPCSKFLFFCIKHSYYILTGPSLQCIYTKGRMYRGFSRELFNPTGRGLVRGGGWVCSGIYAIHKGEGERSGVFKELSNL